MRSCLYGYFFNWCFIPKPQKIADSNFLDFKDWQQLKSAFFGGPSIYRCSTLHVNNKGIVGFSKSIEKF
ncbi:MAG: hypothetical protein LBS83_03025 [Holosporales bacterium]|nr:hypothetical protein [Holosporales bacterium]